MVRVVVTEGTRVLAEREFDRVRMVVGRRTASDICVKSSVFSNRHCVLYRHRDFALVADAGSNGGTRINTRCVDRVFLEPTTRITFGSYIELQVVGCRVHERASDVLDDDVPAAMLFQCALLAPDHARVRQVVTQLLERAEPRSLDIVDADMATVARRPAAPAMTHAMELAARSSDPLVRTRAAEFPGLSAQSVALLAADPDPAVVSGVRSCNGARRWGGK